MCRIASSMYIFDLDAKSLKHRLMKNGFSSNFIEGCVEKVLNKYHVGVDYQKHEDKDDHRKVILTLPYLGTISIILRRNILIRINLYLGFKDSMKLMDDKDVKSILSLFYNFIGI